MTDSIQGRKAVVFGERDDVAGAAIRACLHAAGVEIVHESTACFV